MASSSSTCLAQRVALSGAKGSGKSTLAAHLVQQRAFHEFSFADPLKRLVIDVFQIDPKYCYDPDYKEVVIEELGVSARQLLQVIGSELFRDALKIHLPQLRLRGGGSVWIHSLLKRVEVSGASSRVVVSDCRFEDEYRALKQSGFTTFLIDRPSLQTNAASAHQSEKGCPYDVKIVNASSIADLFQAFDSSHSQTTIQSTQTQ